MSTSIHSTHPGSGKLNVWAHTSTDQLTDVVVMQYGFFFSHDYVKRALKFPLTQTRLTKE